MGRWPMTECVEDIPLTREDDYFFISHRWLAPESPDEGGAKFALLKKWWKLLHDVDELILAANDEQILYSEIEDLIDRRFQLAPIAHKRFYNELPWKKANILNVSKSETLEWLRTSVSSAIDAVIWIDSYAAPARHHRSTCTSCRADFAAMIDDFPLLVAQSTCLHLAGFKSDETSRGWIMLEVTIAHLKERLVKCGHADYNVEEIVQRLLSFDYQCTEEFDEKRIIRLFAIFYTLLMLPPMVNLENEYNKPLTTLPFRKFIENWSGGILVKDIAELLREVSAPYFRNGIRPICGGEKHAGAFTTVAVSMALFSRLVCEDSYRKKFRGEKIYLRQIVYLQSCIYYLIRHRLYDADLAAAVISTCWLIRHGMEEAYISNEPLEKNPMLFGHAERWIELCYDEWVMPDFKRDISVQDFAWPQ
ncbi:hypothetical protein GCM10009087_51410 [Sphingomonas oligophenolica]